MWYAFAVIFIAIAIFALQYPFLNKNGKRKDIWSFSIILLFFTSISVLQTLDVSLPNPLDYIEDFYKLILG